VAIILAFIFLTPRAWFRDQPRIPKASSIAMLPSERGGDLLWMDPELLAGVQEADRLATATRLARGRTGNRRLVVDRIEAIRDSEQQVQGYLVFAHP
jgi:hypothetical protein